MADPRAGNAAVSMRRVVVAAAMDVVLVLLFVLIGRRNHEEAFAVTGVWHTLWPFLGGLAVGWLAARAWRGPFRPVRVGIPVWLGTIVVGMLLRVVSDQGIQPSFVVVAAAVLGAFLVGWRVVGWRVVQRRGIGRRGIGRRDIRRRDIAGPSSEARRHRAGAGTGAGTGTGAGGS